MMRANASFVRRRSLDVCPPRKRNDAQLQRCTAAAVCVGLTDEVSPSDGG